MAKSKTKHKPLTIQIHGDGIDIDTIADPDVGDEDEYVQIEPVDQELGRSLLFAKLVSRELPFDEALDRKAGRLLAKSRVVRRKLPRR